jgi:hypothetical protein
MPASALAESTAGYLGKWSKPPPALSKQLKSEKMTTMQMTAITTQSTMFMIWTTIGGR